MKSEFWKTPLFIDIYINSLDITIILKADIKPALNVILINPLYQFIFCHFVVVYYDRVGQSYFCCWHN